MEANFFMRKYLCHLAQKVDTPGLNTNARTAGVDGV
jgi:hypothetical protein